MTTGDFTSEQLAQLAARRISTKEAGRQLDLLRNGVKPLVLLRPATAGDGVLLLGEAQEKHLAVEGEGVIAGGRLTRFVPASGAASRMFAELSPLNGSSLDDPEGQALKVWNEASSSLPFPATDGSRRAVRDLLYGCDGMANLPKGLVPFHRYYSGSRTAVEEQLVESAVTAGENLAPARIHFTVPPARADDFVRTITKALPSIRQRLRCTVEVDLSSQNPSTDTLASDENGKPFSTADGALLFRLGGHGSLLQNVARLAADLVLIRNIDNIVIESRMQLVVRWHRVLTAFLARTQTAAFALIATLHEKPGPEIVDVAETFVASLLGARHSTGGSIEERTAFLLETLDRPWRVCGMVRNEGEPGGGPFWVLSDDGTERLQIVESAHFDQMDEAQRRIWSAATHFNPVHLVCAMRDWRGRQFNLDAFADQGHSFLAEKTYEGRVLRVLERPGLWNGSMARWNTVAIEVPSATSAPVKTVFDLLRPSHQNRRRIAA
jgi:hypothetical protein